MDIDVSAADGVLFSGDKYQEFNGDWANEATLRIVQDKPYPMTVLALIPNVVVSDEG
jgi:hypothetical protein